MLGVLSTVEWLAPPMRSDSMTDAIVECGFSKEIVRARVGCPEKATPADTAPTSASACRRALLLAAWRRSAQVTLPKTRLEAGHNVQHLAVEPRVAG